VKAAGLAVKVQQTSLCPQQNVVCSTVPKAGQRLSPGKTVTLFTAATATPTTTVPTTQVPNVATDTTNQACNAIVGAGFVCGSSTPVSSNLTSGQVVSTDPAAESMQPKGTTINLNVSSGPSTVLVPSVIGDTQTQAETALQAQNLTVIVNCNAPALDPTTTAPYAVGNVWAQSPSGGQSVPVPSSVTISVVPNSGNNCPS
jgi:serine/threonine-protein kinase